VADFQPVALLGVIPMLLLVNKDLPARTCPAGELFRESRASTTTAAAATAARSTWRPSCS
jgi:tripartite-type tricarboxylate transporter receptor subunit TctC